MSVPSRLVGASRMVGAAARAAAAAPQQARLFGTSNGPSTNDILAGRTKYGGRTTVTLVPGDGVGPELAAITSKVFKVLNVPVDFEEIPVGGDSRSREEALREAIHATRRNGVALKGVVLTERGQGSGVSFNVGLRKALDLFANVVVCKTYPGMQLRHRDVDLIVVRQNTEGEYSHLEHEIAPGIIESLKVVTKENSKRVAQFAFDYATKRNRSRVTAVHKANIMKQGDGLFIETCAEVAKTFPRIKFDTMIVDNTSMQMVSRPQQFDVMVMPNLYGNIIGNIGSGLCGGPGVTPGMNIGPDCAVFEPGSRHAGVDIAGKGIANPSAMLLSAAMMLRHIGLPWYSITLKQAVRNVLAEGRVLTRDIGGQATTAEFVDEVLRSIEDIVQENV